MGRGLLGGLPDKRGDTGMDFFNDLFGNALFQLFSIITIGYLIGGIKIKGIEIGDAGILLVALVA